MRAASAKWSISWLLWAYWPVRSVTSIRATSTRLGRGGFAALRFSAHIWSIELKDANDLRAHLIRESCDACHLTNGRLFDSHAAVDFARTVFEFDAPGFWDLVHVSRILALEKAAEHCVPLVVQTSCYSHPQDLPLLEDFERVLGRHGGLLLPVFLSCSRQTLEARIGAPDRAQRIKVTSRRGSTGVSLGGIWSQYRVPLATRSTRRRRRRPRRPQP